MRVFYNQVYYLAIIMILIQILIISFLVFAIHYTFLPGEIFGFIDRAWDRYKDQLLTRADRLPAKEQLPMVQWWAFLDKLEQPLFKCPVCMAPWYGTALYWAIPWQRIDLPKHDWVTWLIVIIGALGFNSIVVRTFKEND